MALFRQVSRRALLAAPAFLPALAQGQSGQPLIGILRVGFAGDDLFPGIFKRDMARLGYEEGRNYRVKLDFADGDPKRLPALATGLVEAGAQLLVAFSVAGVAAAQAASKTVPIVAMADDLVATGQVASFARPGGNTTGVSIMGRQLDAKRLEVLHELVPGARKVGIVGDSSLTVHRELGNLQAAARGIGLTLEVVHMQTPEQVSPGLERLSAAGVEAVQFLAAPFLQSMRFRFMTEMTKRKLPAMYEWPETVEEGGLSSYGPRLALCYRHVAVLASRVLKGAKPSDLPIEQPTTFTLALNVGAARKIGVVLPEAMLLRADLLVD